MLKTSALYTEAASLHKGLGFQDVEQVMGCATHGNVNVR
jgi:hypothetical protein